MPKPISRTSASIIARSVAASPLIRNKALGCIIFWPSPDVLALRVPCPDCAVRLCVPCGHPWHAPMQRGVLPRACPLRAAHRASARRPIRYQTPIGKAIDKMRRQISAHINLSTIGVVNADAPRMQVHFPAYGSGEECILATIFSVTDNRMTRYAAICTRNW